MEDGAPSRLMEEVNYRLTYADGSVIGGEPGNRCMRGVSVTASAELPGAREVTLSRPSLRHWRPALLQFGDRLQVLYADDNVTDSSAGLPAPVMCR